ncbi:MAG: protein kinase [Gemmatimonadaceae bacterium]|nr:protein kinase [Gemmatimonadaceae bacterium]
MDTTLEDRLERLFEEASTLPPEQRTAFLDEACGADKELRCTLAALVSDAARANDFGDRVLGPAVARVAGVILGDSLADMDDGADPLLGQQIAHFQIVEKLGGGGMGRVYKALDLRLDRTVALKFLPPHLNAEADAKRRFAHEAKAASALDHPNICAIHEIGETDAGQLFIAMAHCDGETLKEKIARGPLPIAQAFEYVARIAEALERAHDAGIVHRDVKPANVMVTGAGVVKIVDFGLAKMAGTDVTREGTTIGTVAYMSPEQTRGTAVDGRSDLWSLGAVLYEMLTGQRPFRGENDETLIYAIRHDEPNSVRSIRPEISMSLAAVVSRCLVKEPARRYQRAGELLADLRIIESGGSVQRPVSPSRVLWYAGVGVVLLLVILAGVALRTRPAARLRSLAVLPVTAFTGNSAQDDLSEGMTDLLINRLSELSGLGRVVSRTSVAQYRNTQKSSRQIGRELGVDALVEMSVMRVGERVRITVNLVKAETERVLWSRSFERLEGDVLTLQREVAQAIARELQIQLTPVEKARLVERAPKVNPEAFALFLQSARTPDLARGMSYLEQAIAKDSTFALAYAKVAIAYIWLPRDKVKAERAIAKALALDPASSDAYDALGLLRMWIDWDWTAAESAFRKAIELNPHNSLAHHELGQLFMRVGRCDEAVAESQQAVLQGPGVAHYQSGLAEIYLYCRRYDDAIREFEKNLVLVRDSMHAYFLIGDAYFYKGQYTQALSMYEKSRWPVPAWAYVSLGRLEEARKWIVTSNAEWARGGAPAYVAWNLARSYASLGEREQALKWLEQTYDMKGGFVVYLKMHPQFDSLRGEPRFQRLLQNIGLAD